MPQTASFPPRSHSCGQLSGQDVDANVVLAGWIQSQRKVSSSLSFFNIKDASGTTQLVANRDTPQSSAILDHLASVPQDSVLLVKGSVRQRPHPAKRLNEPTGEIEVVIHDFTVLNQADHRHMPFLPSSSQNLANEELRARYRHLDLRRTQLTHNLHKRSRVTHMIRNFLHDKGFVEVETPTLLKSSPEGAREFLVPTRVGVGHGSRTVGTGSDLGENARSATASSDSSADAESGLPANKVGRTSDTTPQFYALSQSPQQPKQLLICSGAVDKYYQIARCFRDEDGRKDRQPEFTQVDLEMAFVSWGGEELGDALAGRETGSATGMGREEGMTSSASSLSSSASSSSSSAYIGTSNAARQGHDDHPNDARTHNHSSPEAISISSPQSAGAGDKQIPRSTSRPPALTNTAWRIGGREVRDAMEALVRKIWNEVEGVDLPTRFPVLTYREAMNRFGSDKPDTRFGLEIVDVTTLLPRWLRDVFHDGGQIVECLVVPAQSEFAKASAIGLRGKHDRVVGMKLSEKIMPNWLSRCDIVRSFIPTSEAERGGNVDTGAINDYLNLKPGDSVWVCRRDTEPEGGSTPIGRFRSYLAQHAQVLGTYQTPKEPHFLWVTEFPLFTRADDDKEFLARGRWSSTHHPFTAPMAEDVDKLLNGEIKSVRGQHYDLVLNGVEIGGGSVRVHDASMQEHIFSSVIQLTDREKESFGHLLHALRCGAPPHGGMALGFDRLMAILCGTETIRDVIAFPKTGAGTDVFFKSPSPVEDSVLSQYGLTKV